MPELLLLLWFQNAALIENVNNVLSGPYVERRGLNRNQHHITGGNCGAGEFINTRRAVDDNPVISLTERRDFSVKRGPLKNKDRKTGRRGTLGRPVESGALWVCIKEQNFSAGG